MWDLNPDTELLMELPEEYTFETALADLIDNSLQAVWTNDEGDDRLISVEVSNDKISIFDTGSGMNSTSIEKWDKMGASFHRSYRTQAIGGKPHLKLAFGMFGYGGFIASMHLGRRTEVSSETKTNFVRPVFLAFDSFQDALITGSDVITAYKENIFYSLHAFALVDTAYGDILRGCQPRMVPGGVCIRI